MKILVVDTYYASFLAHAERGIVAGAPGYRAMLDRLLALRFGTSDFYSRNLRALGHDADDLVYNCLPLQQAWAAEHIGSARSRGARLRHLAAKLPLLRRSQPQGDILRTIALAQIRQFRPDVLYLQDLAVFPPDVLREVKRSVRLLVGQIASPLPDPAYLASFDLILTSFPHFVDRFRAQGIASEYFRIGFDPIVRDALQSVERARPCTFVGGISSVHGARTRFLEALAREVDIEFFGYGAESLPSDSPIVAKHRGEAWALDMYRVLAESRITVNTHIDVAENNANNMRLYEATGCGALLLTDAKSNLHELFTPGVEVVTYRDAAEAVEKINGYVARPQEAAKIAAAGQRRTLHEHTYRQRMVELAGLLERYLRAAPAPSPAGATVVRWLADKVGGPARKVLPVDARFLPDARASAKTAASDAGASQAAVLRLRDSWKDPGIPDRQWPVAANALAAYRRGEPVPVFDALVEVLADGIGDMAGMNLVEIGCSSGYYAEVLALKQPGVRYQGCDLSEAFIMRARELFPAHQFDVQDATALTYPDQSFDVVVSGCCLLHIPDYRKAIAETARVARGWAVFHRTPVLHRSGPVTFTKEAYGVEMFEQHFNEQKLIHAFAASGLALIEAKTIEVLWDAKAGDALAIKTYLCRKVPAHA